MALVWRMVSYYPYLFIGAIIFPRWVSQKFKLKRGNPLSKVASEEDMKP